MLRNDILFQTHLNYQLNASSSSQDEESVSLADISAIDLHGCTFSDFTRAILYTKDHSSDINFMESSLETIKPSGFTPSQKYNFIELIEHAKHTAVTIGNMTLFSELQKISSATDYFVTNYAVSDNKKLSNVISFQDYDNYDIKQQPNTLEELGSCVVSGGNDGAVKITANFHDSSTSSHPIISIRFFSLNTGLYLTNRDIIDIDTIYKPNASMIEVFAYMSYRDYQSNHYNYSFDNLLINSAIELDSLDDLYSKHYDLTLYDDLQGKN